MKRTVLITPWILLSVWLLPARAGDESTATGISRLLNPAISVNGLILVSSDAIGHDVESADVATETDSHEHAHAHGTAEKGLNLQEAEVQFTATIDPYTKADLVLAIPGAEGLEIEEAVVSTRSLPAGFGLRFGKLYADLGRHNRLHTHQYPLIDAPLGNLRLLGGEGMNEVGAELSYLLPIPWYGDLIGGVFQGDNERFASTDDEDFAYLLRARNLWDLDDSTTLDLGVSGMSGANETGETTWIGAVDLSVRWEPVRSTRYRRLIWQTEWLGVDEEFGEHDVELHGLQAADDDLAGDLVRRKPWGAYSLVQLRFARTWWAEARFDHFEPPLGAPELYGDVANRWSVLLAEVPSEFSALRLQYNQVREAGDTDHQFLLQFNFTIGSHPAHRY